MQLPCVLPRVILLLGLLLTSALSADPVQTVEIRAASDNTLCLFGQRGKPLEVTNRHVSRFRVVPGITDEKLVSLELVGSKGCFVRHKDWLIHAHDQPKQSPGFNADATFRMIGDPDKGVRFEPSNIRGAFIAVRRDGAVILEKDAAPEKSTFILKKTQ